MKWIAYSKSYRCRDRAGIVVERCTTILMHGPTGGTHSLPGPHGRSILQAAEKHWNKARFTPPPAITRCAGDYLSETTRRRKHSTGIYS
jgi:hypothetical protein